MKKRQPKYSQEEHAKRGTAIYEERVRKLVESGNHGRIVAIDVESGVFEVSDDTLSAADLVFTHHPDAQIWFVRIGYPGVHRFGPRLLAKTK